MARMGNLKAPSPRGQNCSCCDGWPLETLRASEFSRLMSTHSAGSLLQREFVPIGIMGSGFIIHAIVDVDPGTWVIRAFEYSLTPVGDRWRGPVEEPLGVERAEVDAATAARIAKPVMPVGGVQPVAAMEIHRPGHILKIVVVSSFLAPAAHLAGLQLDSDSE
jgi:hypothetical protein